MERASTTTLSGYANCAESDMLAVWNQLVAVEYSLTYRYNNTAASDVDGYS